MSYSEKFPTARSAPSKAEAARLAMELLAAVRQSDVAPPAELDCVAQAQGVIMLPLANPHAGTLYPEHFAMAAIWLGCVIAAVARFV